MDCEGVATGSGIFGLFKNTTGDHRYELPPDCMKLIACRETNSSVFAGICIWIRNNSYSYHAAVLHLPILAVT